MGAGHGGMQATDLAAGESDIYSGRAELRVRTQHLDPNDMDS